MKAKLGGCLGVVTLALILLFNPYKPKGRSEFGQLLYGAGEAQEELSTRLTEQAVAPVEDDLTGGHEIDGSNWALPNIFLHLITGD